MSLALIAAAVGVAVAAMRTPRTLPPAQPTIVNSVTSFPAGHPEWAILRESRKDATPLRMGHARHMDPELKGAPPGGLRCVSCHISDDAGRYMKPITFESSCRPCHEDNLGRINIAEGVVDAELAPHGSTDLVAMAIDRKLGQWVRARPERFIIKAASEAGTAAGAEPAQADQPTSRGRRRASDKDKAEALVPVFESAAARDAWLGEKKAQVMTALAGEQRCGYCHQGIAAPTTPDAAFEVSSPEIPDRWLTRSHFSHAAHGMLRCDECHAAEASQTTADILLPSISSCAKCHAPAGTGGGAPHGCVVCHSYHQPAPASEGVRIADDLRR
jgi:hypothetical protein